MSQLRWGRRFITALLVPLLVLVLLLAVPAPAAAWHKERLWATVNICDTEDNPNVLGVRASMPGNGTRQKMWMRFRATYFDRSSEEWRNVGGNSRSPWIKVGSARYHRQAGRKFRIEPPLPVTSWVVRGIVKYRWTRKRKRGGFRVVRRATQKTLSGHPTRRHGDPYDYSNGICEITFP
jgi:hypothetical protein